MRKLNMEKLAALSTANEILDEKYGAPGTESRAQFDAESQAWYESQISGSYHISMPKHLHDFPCNRSKRKRISISSFISNLVARELNVTY